MQEVRNNLTQYKLYKNKKVSDLPTDKKELYELLDRLKKVGFVNPGKQLNMLAFLDVLYPGNVAFVDETKNYAIICR